ncbi:MAG: peptidoglycan recognition family protein [Candidatus Paceibacterota bacterium]
MKDIYTRRITLENKDVCFGSLAEAAEFSRKNSCRERIEQVLAMDIEFKKPKYLNGERKDSVSEIHYRPEKLGNLGILQAIYPMDTSDMKPMEKPDTIVVHHTGNGSSQSIPKILDIQTGKTGWASIAYHYVIDQDGCIIATRPLEYEGGNVYGENAGKIGIAFASSLDKRELSAKMLDSYKSLTGELSGRFGIKNTIGHLQLYLNKINRNICELRKNVPDLEELSEDSFMSAKDFNEFIDIKQKALQDICIIREKHPEFRRALNDLAAKVSFIKTCPGINFYKYLGRKNVY